MIGGTIVVLGLAGLCAAYVIAPLLRQGATESEPLSASLSRSRELKSQKDQLLASLKDLDDDRATDKIGDADYEALHARLSAQAIEVMQKLDALHEERAEEEEAAREASRPLAYPDGRRSDRRR